MQAQTFHIPPENRGPAIERLAGFLAAALPGKALNVTWGERKRTRSHEQNAYLFGVCYATIRNETGNDVDDLHTFMLGEYFGWREIDVMGSRRKVPARSTTRDESGKTSRLSVGEFADFVTFIHARAAEHGIYIPEPGEMSESA